jgi:hypothetical protein
MLKTVSSITNAIGAVNYVGLWNASTNTPSLASGVGTKGDYYVVSVAGSTNLDGISSWGVGDWAVFNGTAWQRLEGGTEINGQSLNITGNAVIGGSVSSVSGATASTPTATPVTAFSSAAEAVYIVSACIIGSAFPTGFNPVAIVRTSGGVADVVTIAAASNLTITVSGLNVQLTQTTGANQVMQFSALRIA